MWVLLRGLQCDVMKGRKESRQDLTSAFPSCLASRVCNLELVSFTSSHFEIFRAVQSRRCERARHVYFTVRASSSVTFTEATRASGAGDRPQGSVDANGLVTSGGYYARVL